MSFDGGYSGGYGTERLHGLISEVTQSMGYKELKKEQRDAILSFISSNDVFVSLPTGFGKSLIYGCLPVLFDKLHNHDYTTSIVVVVSPLKALMKHV